MEVTISPPGPVPVGPTRPAQRVGDVRLILLLLILAGALRTWVLCRTEVISRDGIIFIDYALQFEHQPWNEVLRHNHQHPGYPLSVLGMSLPVRQWCGRTDPGAMQLSAQLAAAVPGVLLVIPMFFLGKQLFGRRAGFWGALLFQCLPVSGHILSDALSEPLFLLLMTTALCLAIRGLRLQSTRPLILCGACGGLAYITRPEGAVLIMTVALFLCLLPLVAGRRYAWRGALRHAAGVVVPALMIGAPYALVIHGFTNKPSEEIVKPGRHEAARPTRTEPKPGPSCGAVPYAGGRLVPGLPLAVWLSKDLQGAKRRIEGLSGAISETVKGLHYIGCLPALLGLWWHRKRLASCPEAWLILMLCLVHGMVLWRLAVIAGYVSERHVLLLVVCGVFPAMAALQELPRRVSEWRWWPKPALSACRPRWMHWLGNPQTWSLFLLLGMTGFGLPKTFQPLHAKRAGHHAAGIWLAGHTRTDDAVYDGHFGWAHFYAGRFSTASQIPPHPPSAAHTIYVVKGRSQERENQYGPTNARADMTVPKILAAGGRIVYHWPERSPVDRADVVIWRVRLPGAGSVPAVSQ
jgi:hypothetical protein